jgi:hypothetical protein
LVESQIVVLKEGGSSHDGVAFDFESFVGKLTENVGKFLLVRTKNRRKIPLISKYSVSIVETRKINCRKIPLISKYSVVIVGTRRINLIFMSKKFSVALTSESVTSGQAGGVFRQLFLQCMVLAQKRWGSGAFP